MELFDNNKYYVIFPFYKIHKSNIIIFGIRDIKTKEFIDDNKIHSGGNLQFKTKEIYWELTILKHKNYEMIFHIYNVP